MKTDIKEQDGCYLLDMELPGFKKRGYSDGIKEWLSEYSRKT